MQINVLDIIEGTSVDGPGLRTAIYLAGCTHGCKGCHNPQSWDENGGNPTSLETLIQIVKDNDFDVTISGGDPFLHPEQLAAMKADCRKMYEKYYSNEAYVATLTRLVNESTD